MREKQNKNSETPLSLDFEKLRETGLEYLRSVSGNVWTDYGVHDPGVTVLELLCYALMDLGFRTSFDIKDILTPEGGTSPETEGSMYRAHEILPCSPVTVADYRRMILQNVPGVRNVWFEPARTSVGISGVEDLKDTRIDVNGFYRMVLDLESEDLLKKHDYYRQVVGREPKGRYITGFEEKYKDAYKDYTINLFHKYRNLCENINRDDVSVTEHIKVGICAEIEIDRECDCNAVLNSINADLTEYVRPSIGLHSVGEMLAKGKSPEEIFEGPLPKYGFIDTDELESFTRRTTLYVSDALNVIMSVPGVKSVSHLHFTADPERLAEVDWASDFKLELKPDCGKECTFVFEGWPEMVKPDGDNTESFSMNGSLSEITFTINGIPFSAGNDILLYTGKENAGESGTERDEVAGFSPELPESEGTHRFTGNYFSIQNLFPGIYHLGKSGVPRNFTAQDKAHRLQFKAYLLFFERILADYLAQLSSLPKLFSWNDTGADYDLTYFSAVLSDDEIKDLSQVLKDYRGEVHTESVCLERRNRFLNHMLARFNEKFVDYTVINYLNAGSGTSGDFDVRQSIRDKKAFLANYLEFRGKKACAQDLTEKWQYSPVEKRIMSRLGIDNPPETLAPASALKEGVRIFEDNTAESYNTAFGIHILEHNLLALAKALDDGSFYRLTEDIGSEALVEDPYSMRVTALVPGWLDICQKEYFRILVENTIREEVPAHIGLKVCWVDPFVMMNFENAFTAYREQIYNGIFALDEDKEMRDRLPEMVSAMAAVRNIYPPTTIGKSRVHPMTRLNYSVLGQKNGIRKGENWQIGEE